ncbi:MAG: hypothetical protein K9L88_07530, partial [Chromatiaceae bacterium]|nr:hypothetical protein [Chromatiaceae bacterium]
MVSRIYAKFSGKPSPRKTRMGVGSGKDPHGQRQRRSSRGSLERTSDGAHIVKISLRVVADRQT